MKRWDGRLHESLEGWVQQAKWVARTRARASGSRKRIPRRIAAIAAPQPISQRGPATKLLSGFLRKCCSSARNSMSAELLFPSFPPPRPLPSGIVLPSPRVGPAITSPRSPRTGAAALSAVALKHGDGSVSPRAYSVDKHYGYGKYAKPPRKARPHRARAGPKALAVAEFKGRRNGLLV